LVPGAGVGDSGVGELVGSNPIGGTDGVGTGGVGGALMGRPGVGTGGKVGAGTGGRVGTGTGGFTGTLGEGRPARLVTGPVGPEPIGVAIPEARAGAAQRAITAAKVPAMIWPAGIQPPCRRLLNRVPNFLTTFLTTIPPLG
jgi:hypothetical protein